MVDEAVSVFRIPLLHFTSSHSFTEIDSPAPVNRMILPVLSISTRLIFSPAFTAPLRALGDLTLLEGLRSSGHHSNCFHWALGRPSHKRVVVRLSAKPRPNEIRESLSRLTPWPRGSLTSAKTLLNYLGPDNGEERAKLTAIPDAPRVPRHTPHYRYCRGMDVITMWRTHAAKVRR